jgi:hypothetical protein
MSVQKSQTRLLLCRPQGGLTDMLSRVGACCRYADTENRLVIVETDFARAENFRDDFCRYFISHDADLVLTSRDYAKDFDSFDVEPVGFKTRVNDYRVEYNRSLSALAEVGSGLIPSFDLKQKFNAPLLLYHAVGGGLRKAEIVMRRISISPFVLHTLNERLARIGGSYSSVHIRHTDYSTDYKDRILALRPQIVGSLYVATDNREVLDFCREVFGAERVFNFSVFPAVAGEPIHDNLKMDPRQSNLDAICDLLILAMAKSYHFFPISNSPGGGLGYSGFSRLAELLHKDKKLLQQFTHAEEFGFGARLRLRWRKMMYGFYGLASSLR